MPEYNYRCDTCKIKDLEGRWDEVGENSFYASDIPNDMDYTSCSSDLVWVERHGMFEDVDVKCPLCDKEAEKTFIGVNPPAFYFRGNCYLDKEGARRDMNLHTMQHNDPYAHMRQSGEAEDMKDRLKKAGKSGYDKNGRKTTKYFTK